MKGHLAGVVVTGMIVTAIFLTATQCSAQAQEQIVATGSACNAAGCAYTDHHRERLCAEDHERDGHQFRAQGILHSGEQFTVRDGSGAKPGRGCTNPHGGGRFIRIRGGWPGHWTDWRRAG